MASQQGQNRIKVFICIGIAVATLVAYEPVRHNGFVNFDTHTYVTKNPYVNKGITLQSVTWAFTEYRSANWHPLTWISHMLDCELYGLNPLGHHITSLVIHIVNSVLLFLLLYKMTGATWRSAFVAGVFALHPVHVESVAWIAERKDVLSGFFWMLTILVYIRYTERPSVRRYMLVVIIFVMGLMSKPMVVTLPFVLLLLDYWPLELVDKIGRHGKLGRLVLEKVPLIILSAISCVITFVTQKYDKAVISLEVLPLRDRIINALGCYFYYILKMLYPKDLAVLYPAQWLKIEEAMVTVIGASVLLLLCRHGKRRWLAVGLLWYMGTMVPVIGLVQVGSQIMADRYTYIPSIGFFIIIAWAAAEILSKIRHSRRLLASGAALTLITMVFLTRVQAGYWRDTITLWEHTLKVTRDNEVAENNYALTLCEKGRFTEAEVHIRNALRINPAYLKARLALCDVLLKQNKFSEAIACYKDYLTFQQDSARVYYNLAFALGIEKKYDEALEFLTCALNLAPNYPEIHKGIGYLLFRTGKLNEAVEHFNEALKTDANTAEIYSALGSVYSQLGKTDLVIENWTKALEQRSDDAIILNNIAWALVTKRDVSVEEANRAVELAQKACSLTGQKNVMFLDTLGAAYSAAGRLDKAITTAQKALEEARKIQAAGSATDINVADIQERLNLYKSGEQYQQKEKTGGI
ncbi:MAG: tetratricopeptide repeat protein [Sedimentisphaerales bacterium]|nr:tetratricopeptide repeat protein [Sedimentisphaerales bacterium]